MQLEPYILQVPCTFLVDYDTFMRRTAELGQYEGRDGDWHPNSLDVAILEVLLFGDTSETTGVIFMPSDTPVEAAYRCPIEVELNKDPAEIQEHGKCHLPAGWPNTFDNALMALLNSDESPEDYGVTIDDTDRPLSNHKKMTDRSCVATFLRPQGDCPRGSIFANKDHR